MFVVSNSVAGESSLDRLACGLGGKTVLPHIIVTVPQMLQNGKFLTESTSAYNNTRELVNQQALVSPN